MFTRAPDSSARNFLYSSIFWLVLGTTFLAVGLGKLILPEALSNPAMSYPRLMASGSILLQYGFLTMASLAGVFFITPRLVGVQIRSEIAGQLAALLLNVTVLMGVTLTLFGGVADHQFSELPPYLDLVVVLALVICLAVVVGTVRKSVEERLYVSLWYFIGGLVWAPLGIAAGNLHPYEGVADSIAHLFGLNATTHLFFGAIGIGVILYIIPRAGGGTLWSERVGLVGFWVLAFAGPLAGQGRAVLGPGPDWLETISISASIALLVVVLTTVANVMGSLRDSWTKLSGLPSVRFLLGGTALWTVAMVQGSLQPIRSLSSNLGTTSAIEGQVWLALLAYSVWAVGSITFAFPKLQGRKWLASTTLSTSFWLGFLGAAMAGGAFLVAGLVESSVWSAGTALQSPLNLGEGFQVVLAATKPLRIAVVAGFVTFAVAQWMFATALFRSTTSGDRTPVEVVVPKELVP